jgi:hypothetical protein
MAEPIGPVDQGEDEDVAGDEDLKKDYTNDITIHYCHHTLYLTSQSSVSLTF